MCCHRPALDGCLYRIRRQTASAFRFGGEKTVADAESRKGKRNGRRERRQTASAFTYGEINEGKRAMNRRNYQKELDEILSGMPQTGAEQTLFLHCCCAPCSSYVLEYLSAYFRLILFFYNPNITEAAEYEKRKAELKRLVKEKPFAGPIEFADADHEEKLFFQKTKGLEQEPECGRRCFVCYEMRLRKTAEMAVKAGAHFFCTTLSISPHKNADKLMEIGEALGTEYGISYLPSDFKKKNGYKRSIELSKEYDLYRQNYCGCIYSREAASQAQARSHLGTADRVKKNAANLGIFDPGKETERKNRWEAGQ